jgi:hypothetical protein
MTIFRPAFRVDDEDRLNLYLVSHFSLRQYETHHSIMPSYEPISWVFCNADIYNSETKKCKFTRFDTKSAQIIES